MSVHPNYINIDSGFERLVINEGSSKIELANWKTKTFVKITFFSALKNGRNQTLLKLIFFLTRNAWWPHIPIYFGGLVTKKGKGKGVFFPIRSSAPESGCLEPERLHILSKMHGITCQPEMRMNLKGRNR